MEHLNFFRLHLMYFLVVPIISAGIFYASNSENVIPFIDCLFLCVSAMTLSGLGTVVLSSVNLGQQIILFVSFLDVHKSDCFLKRVIRY